MTHSNGNPPNGASSGQELAVSLILDKSGSMRAVQEAVIEGYNDYLDELRNDPAETTFSLTLFDTRFTNVYLTEPLEAIAPLDQRTYRPDGMTALYDAIGHTVIETDKRLAAEGKSQVKVLVVVMTDGLENSSSDFDATSLAALVREYEERGNWTLVYLGAVHDTIRDARRTAAGMGYKLDNAMRYEARPESIKKSMAALSQATKTRRSSAALKSDKFFDDAGQTERDFLAPDQPDSSRPPAKLRRANLAETLDRTGRTTRR
jgi:uncharacterized protein YegL